MTTPMNSATTSSQHENDPKVSLTQMLQILQTTDHSGYRERESKELVGYPGQFQPIERTCSRMEPKSRSRSSILIHAFRAISDDTDRL